MLHKIHRKDETEYARLLSSAAAFTQVPRGVEAAGRSAGDGIAVSSGAWGLQAGRRFAAAFTQVPRGVEAAGGRQATGLQ